MSAFHTCIARLAPSVVDNMYRQALLRWMIQFQRHRHPKQESWQHCYRPFGTAAVTKLDNTAEVRSGNAAHSEGCAGKTHTSYMTTWRSVGVRRGNVAYCLAFSAHTHHLYIYARICLGIVTCSVAPAVGTEVSPARKPRGMFQYCGYI